MDEISKQETRPIQDYIFLKTLTKLEIPSISHVDTKGALVGESEFLLHGLRRQKL